MSWNKNENFFFDNLTKKNTTNTSNYEKFYDMKGKHT